MSSVIQINNKVYIDGVELPKCPSKSKSVHSTVDKNNVVYYNGWEFKDGQWKRSLKALLYCLF